MFPAEDQQFNWLFYKKKVLYMPGIELKGIVQPKINVKYGSVKNESVQEDENF